MHSIPAVQWLALALVLTLAVLSRSQQSPEPECGCPLTYISCAGRCYQRLRLAANFTASRRICQRLKPRAHLAVPRSHHQNLCVAGLSGGLTVWLGVSEGAGEELFVGDDGLGPVDSAQNGHSWNKDEPSGVGAAEKCVVLSADQEFAHWNDRDCGDKYFVMCQLSTEY